MILKTLRNGAISLVVMLVLTFTIWKSIVVFAPGMLDSMPIWLSFIIGATIGVTCARVGIYVFRKLEQRTNYY